MALGHGQPFPLQWMLNFGELTAETKQDLAAMWEQEAIETLTTFVVLTHARHKDTFTFTHHMGFGCLMI